jgi:hypothetical protein
MAQRKRLRRRICRATTSLNGALRSDRWFADDDPGRRSITGKMTGAEALQAAKTLARNEQDKLDPQ